MSKVTKIPQDFSCPFVECAQSPYCHNKMCDRWRAWFSRSWATSISKAWRRLKGSAKMTYSEKVEWLKRYRYAQRTMRLCMEELEQLRSEAASVSQALSGIPSGGGDGQAIPRAVERIEAAEIRLASAYGTALAECNRVKDAIDTVPDPLRRDILTSRYILGQRWERIAADIDRDLRWVLRLHHRAVDELTIESH